MNKFKLGQRVKIIRTEKMGEIAGIGDFDYTKIGQSNACYIVRYSNNEKDWFTVHDLELVKEILDEKEKEYLSNIIRPFRDKVTYIQKNSCIIKEYIVIKIEEDFTMVFPFFEKGTMYKGMESDKKYTLSELGLED